MKNQRIQALEDMSHAILQQKFTAAIESDKKRDEMRNPMTKSETKVVEQKLFL